MGNDFGVNNYRSGFYLKKIDKYSEYIPFASSITSLIGLVTRIHIKNMNYYQIKMNRYYSRISEKSIRRFVVLLIPVIGNVLVAIYDFANRNAKKVITHPHDTKRCILSDMGPAYFPLKYASSRLRNNPEVVGKAVIECGIDQFYYASPVLKANKEFVLYLIKNMDWFNFPYLVEKMDGSLRTDKCVISSIVKKINENNNLCKHPRLDLGLISYFAKQHQLTILPK